MKPEAFLSLFRPLADPYLLLDTAGQIIAWNPAARSLLGNERRATAAPRLVDLTEEPEERVASYLRSCLASGALLPGVLTLRQPGAAPERLRCYGAAIRDESAATPSAILLRVESNRHASSEFLLLNEKLEELTRETHERRRAEIELRQAGRRLSFLAEASKVLASSLDYETTLRNVARLAVPQLADWCAVDIVTETGAVRRVAVEHPDPERLAFVMKLQERYPADPDAPYGVSQVIRTGQAEFAPEIPDSLLESAARDEEHLRLLRLLRLRSYIIAPLSTHDQTLGAIAFVYAESGRLYREEDIPLLQDLAHRAATAIENARLVRKIEEAHRTAEELAIELEHQATQLQDQATELEFTNEELISANEAKAGFLTTMSHELRTPLNALIGYAQLLEMGVPEPIPESARTHVERIQRAAEYQLGLIEEILTFSRLEAGREQAEFTAIPVHDLLDEVRAIVEPLAERKGLGFRVELRDAPEAVESDPRKLRQILVNVLGNAVKFTDGGHVSLGVSADAGELVFSVRDTGTGIRPEDRARLFEPFWQADQSLTRKLGGTGLGLAITRRFVHLLEGQIDVESAVGEGTTVTIRLPMRSTAPKSVSPARPGRES